jgi:hypothetical protein
VTEEKGTGDAYANELRQRKINKDDSSLQNMNAEIGMNQD